MIEDFLSHLQVERRMSAHTLDAYRRDLSALSEWATAQGINDLSTLQTEQVRSFVAAEHRTLLQFGERVELIALVVDARLRRCGAGSTLVAAVEAWARQRRGVQDMVVRSSLTREDSHPFYQRIGYAHHKTQNVYTRTLTP